jgi:hypothetical protein
MAIIQTHIDKGEHTHPPEVKITSSHAVIICNSVCEEDCQFSIADESGRILKKGCIKGKAMISFEGINPGFYQLIIFNEFNRFLFPLKID